MAAANLTVIGDVINSAYGRASKAWQAQSVEGYQEIAVKQVEQGARALDVNIDGTQKLMVKPEEMLAFLPDLIPGLQEAVSVPLCMDNPSVEYQRVALKHYDASKGGKPIVNSVAASRENLDQFYELIKEHDAMVIVMSSEKFTGDGGAQCFSPEEVHQTARQFAEILRDKAGRSNEDLIIDVGLAPVAADTYGLVNMGLDAMALIHADPDLAGAHMSVGLSNFGFGTPKDLRKNLEKAYLTLGGDRGLDYVLANPATGLVPLDKDDPVITGLLIALDAGRPQEGETQEQAGFRQAEKIMDLF